ncbi:MAG: radical SAM protein [Desulfuromonadaceae bacterium]|nr:radical SAM protein [Desulfuromonadaceae bacterium]MDD5104093.1 radical SAM protein [Desulfuromonadaceae bacterium]
MNVLFLNPPFGSRRPEGLDAPLGIMYLAAVLKDHGHSCRMVDHAWEGDGDWSTWEAALDDDPELVLINTQIRFTRETEEAVRRLHAKNAKVPAIAFGPQASTEAHRLLEMGFNACVIGEPETVVPELLQNSSGPLNLLPHAGLATVYNPCPQLAPPADVETLPFPDWDLVDYDRYIKATHNAVFTASRGLDRPDAFNEPPLIHATGPTRRCSVTRVIRELTELRRKFPGNYMLLFHDEVFTEDRAWVMELCAGLREACLGVPFWCFTRPDLMDDELCRIMARSGFAGVSMGMESGSDRILTLLDRNLTVNQIKAGFRAAHAGGLLTVGSTMIGTPGQEPSQSDETWEEIEATATMVRSLHPDVLTITLTTPLPGTPLHASAVDRLRAASQEDFNYYHVWPGKYPVQLESLKPDDLARGVVLIRGVWRQGLGKTAWQLIKLGCRNAAFRRVLLAQAFRVIRRKVVRSG